ncbi:MAG: dephospho-CoA kinase [Actinomycetota bacterium]|nr:dephospho-CoA kinase [Actinomycetota bacterium]
MLLVGLTGGIGAGKSTVAAMLAARGAIVVDADKIVRELQQKGTDVYRRIVERFGDEVVSADGSLDRQALADIVFRDDDARAGLNAIVHPDVMRAIAERIEEHQTSDDVLVLDVPLLVEVGGGEGLDLTVVVEADEEVRVHRVVRERGLDPEQVRVRMATQASSEQRRALADVVIVNDGDMPSLARQIDELWKRIQEARR